MKIGQAFDQFFGTLKKTWDVVFYTISACSLYIFCIVCISLSLKWSGHKDKISSILTTFTVCVALYIVIKSSYVIVTWIKKRKTPKVENEDRDTIQEQPVREERALVEQKPLPPMQKQERIKITTSQKMPSAEIQKVGDSHW